MSYTIPAGNLVPLPVGGGLSYTPPSGNVVALPLEDDHPAPVPFADAYSIALNTARTVSAPGILGNDTLYTGILSSHTSPAHGTLTLNSDGSFTFTPTGGYTGTDSFTYTVGNDNGFGTATVSLTVYAAPVTVGHTYYALWNATLTVSAPGVLNGCTINGATITAHTSPSHGSLTLNANGSFVYTPTGGYTGTDSFTFTLSNYAGSSTSTISLVVEKAPNAVTDAYSTVQSHALTVAAPGALTNDDVEGATVAFGTGPAHGSVTFNTDGSFVYTPTSGYAGADSFTYTLTNDVGTSTGTVNITVTALPAAHHYLQASTRSAWSMPPRQRSDVGMPWIAAPRKAAAIAAGFAAAPRVPLELAGAWQIVPRRPMAVGSAWAIADRAAAAVASPWARLPRVAASTRAPWTMQPRRPAALTVPWAAPPRRSAAVAAPFALRPRRPAEVTVPWLAPPRRGVRLRVPWGVAHRVAWRPGDAPGIDVPPFVPPGPVYVPPAGTVVDLPLECLWFDEPGGALALPFGPFACYASSLHQKRYIVLNTATVVRLPERTAIAVESGSLQASLDSLYWQYSFNLADPSHLSYLLPDGDGKKLLELNVNGYVFTALIEAYQRQRQFPVRTVSVTGRSRTVTLDGPDAPQRSYVQPSDMTANQLVDNELTFTGYTADYGAVDWLVPAGTYHYDASTPIGSIQAIAAASGSIVQSHPWDTVLLLRPRYPVSPWNWSTASLDKTWPVDIVLNDSLQPASKSLYNYVLVSGEQVGVSDPIVRDGSAGDIRLPQIVDPLIVTHPVALERGRNALSDRGEQAAVTQTIPLGVVADTSLPGLIMPGYLCKVVDPEGDWIALCSGVRIDFQTADSGNGAKTLVVSQTVTLERHYSDA